MKRLLRNLFFLLAIALPGVTLAQEIKGVVLDDKKQPVIGAVVEVFSGGIKKGGTVTDIDGNYSIKPLDPSTNYEVVAKYAGLEETHTTNVVVSPDQTTEVNVTMEPRSIKTVNIVAYKKPLVNKYSPGDNTMTKQEFEKLPTRDVNDAAALSPGVYQNSRGGGLSIQGGRGDATQYIVDGVVAVGAVNQSQYNVDQIQVLTSGVSAKYGDFNGGVVSITTTGITPQLAANVLLQHSIDGYNNNLVNFNLSGPLVKRKGAAGTNPKPIVGFSVGGDYYYDNDRYPSFYEQYRTKASVLKQFQQNPLTIVTDNSGQKVYNPASDYVTASDLERVKLPSKDLIKEYRLNGKLDFALSENTKFTVGGQFNFTASDAYGQGSALFAPDAIPVNNATTIHGYVRFTQRLGKPATEADSKGGKQNIISNAFYTVQADYQNYSTNFEDPRFKHNIFDYQYVGKFTKNQQAFYATGATDSASGRTGTVYAGDFTTGINYQRSNLNPVLANYTSEYYASLGEVLPFSIQQIQANNAMTNGDLPYPTYGFASGIGTSLNGYQFTSENQYNFTADASFDLLLGNTKHAIEFGLSYRQRVAKSYTLYSNLNGAGTTSLWYQMRQLVSSTENGGLVLDKAHPIFIVHGKQYTLSDIQNKVVLPSATDTIIYNYKNVGSSGSGETQFDKNLRDKLKVSSTQDINVEALDPSTFSINMFTADELLNSGTRFAYYQGYSYTGGAQTGTVNFSDFWTQKDSKGNYTRPLPAYAPNYTAGYILDNFQYKDLLFNVGVRIERYDNNTYVLDDPYSLYQEQTVSQVKGSENTFNNGVHPSNMQGNYVVYVDNNTSTTPTVVGYRTGDTWYDPHGNQVQDPRTLLQYTGGRDPQPALVNSNLKITDTNFNPNNSFTKFTPQVEVLPRISFSFPISDEAVFYAHYDIYAMRPTTGVNANAATWYYLSQNAQSLVPNPNLKPQLTYDYEAGFQQKLTNHSSVTLSGFYEERKNMITVIPYLYAWPTTYYSFGNRDFSTTKGLKLKYDLRPINHFSLNLSYTLQFAEGSGSDALGNNSGSSAISANGLLQSFIAAGEPNLRYISALNTDTRHTVNAVFDYRYNQGQGPTIKGNHVFQNMGLDVIGRARSGEPYTRLANAPASAFASGGSVVGGVNGSRIPWHYGVDAKLDKTFALRREPKQPTSGEAVKVKRPLALNAFIYVQNIFNIRDVLGVYGYTGKPNDDGYLSGPYGKQYVPQQINPQSYKDLYNVFVNNSGFYNLPRQIFIGASFNF
jgi:Carboxypeptidase regulatory-like domain/TonB-dependent Receptor Plug Domain